MNQSGPMGAAIGRRVTDRADRVSRGVTSGWRFAMCCATFVALAGVGATTRGQAVAEAELMTRASVRRPIRATVIDNGRTLAVANRRTGTVSLLEARSGKLLSETVVGTQLSDLVRIDDGLLVAADDGAHQLALLEVQGQAVRVAGLARVTPHPTRLVWDAGRRRLWVSSVWGRRVDVLELNVTDRQMSRLGNIDLDWAPRALVLGPGSETVVVADGFGGRVAVVDAESLTVKATHELPAHNIADIALSPDGEMFLITQHTLSELAKTVDPDVHWGVLMSNDLRWIRADRLLGDGSDLFAGAHLHSLGQPGNAAADPGSLAVRGDGLVAVALAGVDEVALGYEHDPRMYRIPVGDRPIHVALSADGGTAYVVNHLDDTVSVVSLDRRSKEADWTLGPRGDDSAADRGERLFYDARLSMDGWMSCHSCHTDGHTAGLMNDNLSDGTFGAPKRILSLLGVADTAPYAWNGQMESLEKQIAKSVRQTMQGSRDLSANEVADLAAYLRSLEPPPSLIEVRGKPEPSKPEPSKPELSDVELGRVVFERLGCARCHQPPTFTTPRAYDVGLVDELGEHQFNPPSLRGVSQRGPYLHDNRAKTLDELFGQVRHRVPDSLSDADRASLIAFLQSL